MDGAFGFVHNAENQPWGKTRPDFGRAEVRQFIRDNVMMWLNDFHINGLRFDSTLYMRSSTGDGNTDLPEGWSLKQWLNDEVANGKARVPHEIDPHSARSWFAQKRSTLAAALVFTAPGIPMLFQGQAFLQGEWFRDDVPLDWNLNGEFNGIVRLYRDLIALRLNRSGETRGLTAQNANVFHVNDDANVLAFHRFESHGHGDDVVVVMNFSIDTRGNCRIGLPAAGRWRLSFNRDASIYSPDFSNAAARDIVTEDRPQDGFASSAVLDVPPYSTLIYMRPF